MTRETGKRRYCLVGPAYPYRGGISHYNTRLAGELARRAETLAINYSRLYPGFLFPGTTQLDESGRPLAVESRRLVDSINLLTWIRAGAAIVRWRPDAVIVQWWHPFFAPALFAICATARLRRGTRIVFVCHNVLPHERSGVDVLLARIAFSTAHAFVVQSEEDRRALARVRPGARVALRPMPLFDFFGTGTLSREAARAAVGEGDGPLLLFFGLVRSYKGVRHLIEAMPLVRERVPARLLVVGEFYEDDRPYRALVERLGLGGCVRFVDRYVPNEEVERYFAAADLVVLPYLSATQSAVAPIAIALDRPVVVTSVGGLPEAVAEGRTGFVVPPGDARAIARAVVSFFEEGWAARMAPHFAEEKRRFSWEALVGAIEELAGPV